MNTYGFGFGNELAQFLFGFDFLGKVGHVL
jgi:hypothetical protein